MRIAPPPLLVEILSKPDCHLCEEAKRLLREVQSVYPFTLREIDIRDNTALLTQFGEEIPVVFINGRKAFKY
ncbi:MAG: glutaredoxin family protein, partial [Candidatus Tectomicrobia bacterium]